MCGYLGTDAVAMEGGGMQREFRGPGVGNSQGEVTEGGRGIFTPLFLQRQFTFSFQMSFLSSLQPLSFHYDCVFKRFVWEILELWVTRGMVVGKGKNRAAKQQRDSWLNALWDLVPQMKAWR